MKLSIFCALFRKCNLSPPRLKSRRLSLYSPHYYQRIAHPVGFSSSSYVGFHCCVILNAKRFQEKENDYAHNVMENLPSYNDSIVKYPFTHECLPFQSSSELVKDFVEFSILARKNNLSLEESKYIPLITKLSNIMPQLSDEDIILTLQYLCLWPPSPKSFSCNFKRMWNTLDFQCTQRFLKWNLNRKLVVADYFFHLRLNRISQYNKNLIANLLESLPTLSDSQIVQLMFYVNLQRRIPQAFRDILEKRLLSVISKVSLEEVGIICLGFFKTENKISNFEVIELIIRRLSTEIGQVNTLTVVSILKFLRKSMHLLHTQSYIPLLQKCISYIPNLDIPTAVHLALLSSECHVYHPLLLHKVTEKVADNIENARIKDCKKLLQCLSHFNFYSESKFHELFLRELKKDSRKTEAESYIRDLAYIALFYAYLGYYDYEIVNTVLEPKFLQACRMRYPETIYTFPEIDYCIEIECKDYKGHRLNKEELKLLRNRRGNLHSENPNSQMRLTSGIIQSLEKLGIGKNDILIRHILPHFFSPDIIVRLSGASKSLSDLYCSFPPESILEPPHNEIWACFVVGAPFAFAYKSKHITGATAMKLRQLKRLNYKIVFVPFYELPMNNAHRMDYIKGKLDKLQKELDINLSVKLQE